MNSDKYRTGSRRLLASIVDSIVFMPLMLMELWIYKMTSNITFLFVWGTLVAMAPVIYSVLLHYKFGQTIGKWVTKVKVLDATETRKLSLWQALLRDSFFLLVLIIEFFYHIYMISTTENPEAVINDYLNFSENLIICWALIELITMLTNSRRRALHDFLAHSVVVRTTSGS